MENLFHLGFCLLTGFALSYAVIIAVLQVWQRRRGLQRPADFHHTPPPDQAPVPRLGGIALAAAFAVICCLPVDILFGYTWSPLHWVIAGTSLGMFGLGLWDDLQPLGAKKKLMGQLILASAAYYWGLGIHQFKIPLTGHIIELGLWSWPVTVFWLVALTNLINLIDGVDGLAGGICLMLMALLTLVGGETGCLSLMAAGMVGALLAFLRFNFPPARIYLGDSGAYFLGFLIGVFTIYNSHKGTVIAALIAPLFVLVLPILDTSIAIIRRGLHGLPLFRPDRQHLHHRLLESGLSRRRLVLGAYVFTAFFLALGMVVFWWREQYLPVMLGVGTLTILLMASRFSFSRCWFAVPEMLGSSLNARMEIQFALAQTNWLVLEGRRGGTIQSICEDTAFIASKLGFSRLRIQLKDGERMWEMAGPCAHEEHCLRDWQRHSNVTRITHNPTNCQCYAYRHTLPGHPDCCIEFQTRNLNDGGQRTEVGGQRSEVGSQRPEVSGQQNTKQKLRKQKVEIGTTSPGAEGRGTRGHSTRCLTAPSKISILSDVLAEGWAKALTGCKDHKGNRMAPRWGTREG